MTARARKSKALDPAVARAIDAAAERAAKRATNRAVKQILLQLGVNAETGKDAQEHQQDMHFLRRVRVASESRPAKLVVAGVSAFLMMLGGIVVASFKYFLEHFNVGPPHG